MRKFLALALAIFLSGIPIQVLADTTFPTGFPGSASGGGGGAVSSVSGSGAGISVSPTTGATVVQNTGVTSAVAGTGIGVSGGTGAVTITNNGIRTVTGTASPQNIVIGGTSTDPTVNIGSNVVTKTTGTGFQSVVNRPELYPNYRNKVNRILSHSIVGGKFVGCEVGCEGDSTTTANQDPNTTGAPGATQTDGGYPRRLVEALNSYGVPAVEGWQTFDQYNNGVADPRLTLGTGWTVLGTQGPDGNGWGIFNSGTTGILSYVPNKNIVYDTVSIIYEGNTSWGSVTVDVDGGASLGTLNSAAANTWFKTTYTVPRGTHVLNINGSGNSFMLIAIEVYDSTVPSVHVGNLGSTGSTSAGWIRTGGAFGGVAETMQALLQQFACDLYIVNLTINDAAASTVPATYQSNINSLIAFDKNSIGTGLSDVIIGTGIPNGDPTIYARQQILFDLIRNTIAPANNCAFYDLDVRLGGYNAINSTAYNYYKADQIHFSFLGYYDFGWSIATMLTPQPGSTQFTNPGMTTIAGSAGNCYVTFPKRDAENKKVVIKLVGYTAVGATVIKFPFTFAQTPDMTFNNSILSPTVSTSQISIPAATLNTSTIIVDGI